MVGNFDANGFTNRLFSRNRGYLLLEHDEVCGRLFSDFYREGSLPYWRERLLALKTPRDEPFL